ncbi:hypothetical protein D9M69_399760 [compost metagenome]
MPNGECRFSRNAVRVSATPSPSASRSRLMRLALGTPAPALAMIRPAIQPFSPPPSRAGALLSATSTSPLGSTYSQRGWSSPPAKALTWVPVAATGLPPSGQPTAGAMLTVGNSVLLGGGSFGFGPVPSSTVRVELSPQPIRLAARRLSRSRRERIARFLLAGLLGGQQLGCPGSRPAMSVPFASGCGDRKIVLGVWLPSSGCTELRYCQDARKLLPRGGSANRR